jgi:hypothetical protein
MHSKADEINSRNTIIPKSLPEQSDPRLLERYVASVS